jgi:xylulose-5-phosphate/fructose-6-phosphate phosphoketolase
MRLVPPADHPHGLPDEEFDGLFPVGVPVIVAYHGYPTLIHHLTYKRANHSQFHVHGYKEEGTTTTPFDMVMLNELDRYRLAMDVIDRVPGLATQYASVRVQFEQARGVARAYTRQFGDDIPIVRDWVWQG